MKGSILVKTHPSSFLLGSALSIVTFTCLSQQVDGTYYAKLSIEAKHMYEVVVDSLYIDTLVLEDQSILKFTRDNTILIVENAYIANNCIFDGSGRSGANSKPRDYLDLELDGEDGHNGLNLKLYIVFKTLVSLTIKTTGGDGGKGAKGRDGVSGQHGALGGNDGARGENGGKGGNGGHGGNLQLYYASVGFTPVFNSKSTRRNVINLNLAGGKSGSGGNGGRGGFGGRPTSEQTPGPDGKVTTSITGTKGKDGMRGFPGVAGKPGEDGELILKRIPD